MINEIVPIEKLKDNLYKNYSRKELSNYLEVTEVQISRILNQKRTLSFNDYVKLLKLYEVKI